MYFGCHKCGQCCVTEPALKFNEILKFYKEFIITVKVKTFYVDDVVGENVKKHLESTCIQMPHTVNFRDIFVQIYPQAYNYLTLGYCSKLNKDNTCSIYENRPKICATRPFVVNLPESEQFIHEDRTHNVFFKEGCLSKEPKQNLEKVYDDGKIALNFSTDRMDIIKDFQKHKDTLKLFINFMDSNVDMFINPKQLSHSMDNLFFLLTALCVSGKLSKEEMVDILFHQAYLINNAVTEALKRKNKEDKDTTAILRDYLDVYKNSQIFLNDFIERMSHYK